MSSSLMTFKICFGLFPVMPARPVIPMLTFCLLYTSPSPRDGLLSIRRQASDVYKRQVLRLCIDVQLFNDFQNMLRLVSSDASATGDPDAYLIIDQTLCKCRLYDPFSDAGGDPVNHVIEHFEPKIVIELTSDFRNAVKITAIFTRINAN